MDEPKNLSDIVLNPDSLPESLREKFANKSVEDVLKSYEEAQKLTHEKAEALRAKEEEIELMRQRPDPDPIVDDVPEPDEDYNSLFGDDDYVTADVIKKQMAQLQESHKKELSAVEDRAVAKAMAQIEKRSFIEKHPEYFNGKNPQEVDAIIQRVAAAGYVSGKQSLEGGLEAIREMSGQFGFTNPEPMNREIPRPLANAIGEFTNSDDEVDHMINYHKKAKNKISDLLK